jgi:4-hydroxybenzoate polyprenyltransferase
MRILHPFPSLLVALLTVALVPLADSDAPLWRYAVMGLGMLCYQFAIGVTNDIADLPHDRAYKPSKPLVAGTVAPRTALALALALILGGLVLTLALPFDAWLIGIAGLVCGLAYDLFLKRTALSWLPLSIAIPLVPAWVFVASDAWDPLLWWAFPLGGALGLALHLANQAPDVAAGEVIGLAGRLGAERSRLLSLVLFGIAALVAAAVLLDRATGLAACLAIISRGTHAAAPHARRYLGRDGLFGLLAVASAALAVIFLAAV